MATLKQALAILLAKPEPPWNTRSLAAIFNTKSLSLRAVINAVDARKALLFVEVRPSSLLNSVSMPMELPSKWSSVKATQETLTGLFGILQPLGISIGYVSKDLQTIGILGTVGSLLQVQALTLHDPNSTQGGQNQSGLANLAQGLAAEGAGFAALAAAESAAGLGAILLIGAGFLGFAAAGLFLAVGIYELMAGATTPTTPSQVTTTADPNQPVSIADSTGGKAPDNLPQSDVEALLNYFNAYGVFPELPGPGELPDPGDGSGDGSGEDDSPGGV